MLAHLGRVAGNERPHGVEVPLGDDPTEGCRTIEQAAVAGAAVEEHPHCSRAPLEAPRAVHAGLTTELEIQDRAVELAPLHGILRAGGRHHLVTEPSELPTQRPEDAGLVVDDENTRHGAMRHDPEQWANKPTHRATEKVTLR